MSREDTVKLLKECNSGIKMGVEAIDEVFDSVTDEKLRSILNARKDEHAVLGNETKELLHQYNEEGKEPNPMAKGMSFLKTNMKLLADRSDETAADLITDGCNMGIKSLNRYLNQYSEADEAAKDLTKRIIALEEKMVKEMKGYL